MHPKAQRIAFALRWLKVMEDVQPVALDPEGPLLERWLCAVETMANVWQGIAPATPGNALGLALRSEAATRRLDDGLRWRAGSLTSSSKPPTFAEVAAMLHGDSQRERKSRTDNLRRVPLDAWERGLKAWPPNATGKPPRGKSPRAAVLLELLAAGKYTDAAAVRSLTQARTRARRKP